MTQAQYEVTASTTDGHRVTVAAGPRETALDLAVASGGAGELPNPDETLLAALGGCTVMTLHLYAARKGWELGATTVRLTMDVGARGEPSAIRQDVVIDATLEEAQRKRLEEIAGRCPIHRLLEAGFTFEEHLTTGTPS